MPGPFKEITEKRLEMWGKQMVASHATPLLLIGVGHDEAQGTIIMCTLEDHELSLVAIRTLLLGAIRKLGGLNGI